MTVEDRVPVLRAQRTGIPLWMPLLVVSLVPIAILRIKLSGVRDPDAFWHIRGGEHTWSAHSVVGPDPLGTFTSHTWVQHEWLSEVVMAAAYRVAGLAGVAWLYAVADIVVYLAIYRVSRERGGVLVSGVVAAAAWLGISASLVARPQTISFILLAVTAIAWLRTRDDLRQRWWLVPMTWVWACGHGLWFTGPLLGFVVVIGLVLDRAVSPVEARRLLVIPVLSILAAALTPIGPRLLVTPFTVNSYARLVTEWMPPDIHEPFVASTMALVVLVAIGWATSGLRTPWTEVLLWVMALGWALLYSRTVALGAVTIAPLAAGQLQRATGPSKDPVLRLERLLVLGVAAGVAAVTALLAPAVAGKAAGMPTAFDARLDAFQTGTVVFNDDSVGGWLYLTHPQLRPVIDTRTEIYDTAYLERYIAARQSAPGWQGFVAETAPAVALLKADAPLTESLRRALGWRQVQDADGYVMLMP